MKDLIHEFWRWEKQHGKKSTAFDVVMNGYNRNYVFCNDPKNQRMCHCQKCGTKIPREVPRIKFDASYFYGAGYHCLSCGVKMIRAKMKEYNDVATKLKNEVKALDEIAILAEEIMTHPDDFYAKKMALGKMLQVMSENKRK